MTTRILGIHDGHNSSACLVEDGAIRSCVQEERFRNTKNFIGFPAMAVKYCLESTNTSADDLALVAFASKVVPPTIDPSHVRASFKKLHRPRSKVRSALRRTPLYGVYTSRRQEQRVQLAQRAGLPTKKIRFFDHHDTHAATAYFGSPWREDVLVLTLDGGGDRVCSRVYKGNGAELEALRETPDTDALGHLYSRTTFLLGMTPWEHEYKVMGLAPYCPEENGLPARQEFESLLGVDPKDPLRFKRRTRGPTRSVYPLLRRRLEFMRFDQIARGLQDFTEELITRWVRSCLKETGCRRLAVAGGVFMNVKANQRIAALPEVDSVFFMPSCSDESISIGAALLGYAEMVRAGAEVGEIQPLGPLYLGPEIREEEADAEISRLGRGGGLEVEELADPSKVLAELLAEGHIVARCSGRMEFGARALGNRSIFADPSKLGVVQTINSQIKNRDFWMPFAPLIMSEMEDYYIHNPKHIPAPYMVLSFDTQPSRGEIRAAIHAADETARPQVLEQAWNPSVHEALRRFRDTTGRGAFLNTSFNLHGYPVVCSAKDAFWVFENSGLEFMILENRLVSKGPSRRLAAGG